MIFFFFFVDNVNFGLPPPPPSISIIPYGMELRAQFKYRNQLFNFSNNTYGTQVTGVLDPRRQISYESPCIFAEQLKISNNFFFHHLSWPQSNPLFFPALKLSETRPTVKNRNGRAFDKPPNAKFQREKKNFTIQFIPRSSSKTRRTLTP